MNTKITQSLVAGIAATVVMSIVMMIASKLGLAEMNPPAMVAGMLGMPLAVGWLMHFMIGIFWAATFVFFFRQKLPMNNTILKGVVFGIIIAVMAKIGMTIMGAPQPAGSMLPMVMALVFGHVVFGIVTAKIAKAQKITRQVSL